MFNLSLWFFLIIGLLIGGLLLLIVGALAGWLLSLLSSSSGQRKLEEQVGSLEASLRSSSAELAAARNSASQQEENYRTQINALETQVRTHSEELEQTRNQLASLQTEYEQRLAAARPTTGGDGMATRGAVAEISPSNGNGAAPAPLTDDFTQIRGIGPAFAARLAEMGITRYADLAAANPEELSKALGTRPWQKVDMAAWVSQAKTLAKRPPRVTIGDDLTRLEGIGPTYAIRLRAAGITTYRQLADTNSTALAEIIAAPAWRRTDYDSWIAQARLAADGDEAGLKTLQDQLFARKGDNLDLIAGIGATALAALRNAGITSYAALAESTPEQIQAILRQNGVRGGDPASWIAEAKLRVAGKRVRRTTPVRTRSFDVAQVRSCPQDLEAVPGIAQTYEQRLYAVGVGTYWELGMLSDEQLTSILGVRHFQQVDLARIKSEAMRLAQETDTMGHVWDGSEPDDFDGLEGIGPIFERRLYAAGICTFADLAVATQERLELICQAPAFNRPNFARWIEQARAYLAQAA